MVVSLKANKKRIIAFLVLAAVVVGACFLLLQKPNESKEVSVATNEARVTYLEGFGWQVDAEPAETREVMIPAQFNDVYTAYNVMQKAQGFDLKPYAGEVCTQYKYKINNYPEKKEVYATMLVYGDILVGGDVACGEMGGFMHGFARDSARYGESTAGNTSSAAPASSLPAQPQSSAVGSEVESSVSSAAQTDAQVEGQTESAVQEEVESATADTVDESAYPTD